MRVVSGPAGRWWCEGGDRRQEHWLRADLLSGRRPRQGDQGPQQGATITFHSVHGARSDSVISMDGALCAGGDGGRAAGGRD